MGVNSFPKTVTRQRRGCDLNPGRTAPESSTITTRLPSHPACLPSTSSYLFSQCSRMRRSCRKIGDMAAWGRVHENKEWMQEESEVRPISYRFISESLASELWGQAGTLYPPSSGLVPLYPHGGGYRLQVKDAAYIKILSKRL